MFTQIGGARDVGENSTVTVTASQATIGKRSQTKKMSRSDEVLELVAQNLRTPNVNPYDSFGKYVSDMLNRMTSRSAAISKKLICDILFEGEMERITDSTQIIHGPQVQPIHLVNRPQSSTNSDVSWQSNEEALAQYYATYTPI